MLFFSVLLVTQLILRLMLRFLHCITAITMRVIADAVNKSIEAYITTKQVEKMISVLLFKAVFSSSASTTREMITSRMLMIIMVIVIFPILLRSNSFILFRFNSIFS